MLKSYLDFQLAEETECWITVYEFHSADGFVPDWAPIKNWVDFRIKRGCRPTDTFLRPRTTTTLPGQSQYEAYLEEDGYGP